MVVSHLALSLYHLCHDGALDVVAGVLESLTLGQIETVASGCCNELHGLGLAVELTGVPDQMTA